jgi:signal transduction histidine kinase
MMKSTDLGDLDLNIAIARVVLSVLALASWYVDPANGGWFFIDGSSLVILALHLAYSVTTFVLIRRRFAISLLPVICSILDIAFAGLITFVTEGPTSPSWLFFLFAIVVVGARLGFRAAIIMTICSALLYFVVLAAFIPGPKNEYLMRSSYLAIIGYLVGFIGAQRARFETRVRDLELDTRLQRADRLATIGTLASGLAHEIGTPLAVIRTRGELLLETNTSNERVREGLKIILSQIERISRIVRMLLDYAGNRQSVRGTHDVRAIIDHVLKLVDTEAKRRSVRIVVEISNEPLTVDCDAEKLQQVFINLAVNAFDAMTPGGGNLKVSAAAEHTDNDIPIVKLTFEDNGPGVPPQFQEHLFDPFFTTKAPGKGTGMGLSVSQAIIHDHNGEISFESRTSGSRFYVRIPMVSSNNSLHINGNTQIECSA